MRKGVLVLVVSDRRMGEGVWMSGEMLHRVYRSIGVKRKTWRSRGRADIL